MGALGDLAHAVRAGWLELWYQPKINARTLMMCGAEALLRVRDPDWGVLPLSYFIANDGNPRLRCVSELVISRATDDWYLLLYKQGPVEIAVNLPIGFLQDDEALRYVCQKLPNHAAFDGLLVEVNGTDVVRNLDVAKQVAKALLYNVSSQTAITCVTTQMLKSGSWQQSVP